jgi:signal transduction histidine kinase
VTSDGQPVTLSENLTDADGHCSGDEFRLAQVFDNLFANALAA